MKKRKKVKKRIVWFARAGDIARCGPFDSQVEAVNALRLHKTKGSLHEFLPNMFVWPEEL